MVKASQFEKDLKRGITRLQEENPDQNPKLGENVSFATRKDIIERMLIRKKKLTKKNGDKSDVSVASNGYESLDVLVASINDSGNNGYWNPSVHFI